MQAENTSLELPEGLSLRNKYTNNEAKLFNIITKKQIDFKPCFSINIL